MARLPSLKRLTNLDLPEAPGWFSRAMVTLNSFMQDVFAAFNHGLTFQENFSCQVLDISYTPSNAPLSIATTLTAVNGVILLGITGTGFTSAPALRWTRRQNSIVIEEISGLTVGEVYNVKILVV